MYSLLLNLLNLFTHLFLYVPIYCFLTFGSPPLQNNWSEPFTCIHILLHYLTFFFFHKCSSPHSLSFLLFPPVLLLICDALLFIPVWPAFYILLVLYYPLSLPFPIISTYSLKSALMYTPVFWHMNKSLFIRVHTDKKCGFRQVGCACLHCKCLNILSVFLCVGRGVKSCY